MKRASSLTAATFPALASDELCSMPAELVLFCEQERPQSLSVGHFATVLTKKIFSEDERKGRNCLGRRSKLALDPVKLGLIKKLVFRYFVVIEENKESTWKECIIRIDEMLRRKIRVAVTPPDNSLQSPNTE